jgi:hypothetical protein
MNKNNLYMIGFVIFEDNVRTYHPISLISSKEPPHNIPTYDEYIEAELSKISMGDITGLTTGIATISIIDGIITGLDILITKNIVVDDTLDVPIYSNLLIHQQPFCVCAKDNIPRTRIRTANGEWVKLTDADLSTQGSDVVRLKEKHQVALVWSPSYLITGSTLEVAAYLDEHLSDHIYEHPVVKQIAKMDIEYLNGCLGFSGVIRITFKDGVPFSSILLQSHCDEFDMPTYMNMAVSEE